MKVTDAILGEHGALKHYLAWVWRSSEDGVPLPAGWVEGQAEALTCLLGGHAEAETRLLFRFLPQDDPWVIHVTNEHAELDRLLGQARRGSRECLRRLCDVAWGHFKEEEAYVIPLALQVLSADVLERLGTEWAKSRKVNVLRDPLRDGRSP